MFWEGYVCEYEYDDDGFICGTEGSDYLYLFETYTAAMEWFKNIIDDDTIAHCHVKVYNGDFDKKGDILCAFSMKWNDPIFNNNAV